MRGYALLLGSLLTVGYGYAAQVAVASAGFARRGAAAFTADAPAAGSGYWLDRVWYGGVLDPVTVEAPADPGARVTVTRAPRLGRETPRCLPAVQPRYRVTSAGNVRTSMGLGM